MKQKICTFFVKFFESKSWDAGEEGISMGFFSSVLVLSLICLSLHPFMRECKLREVVFVFGIVGTIVFIGSILDIIGMALLTAFLALLYGAVGIYDWAGKRIMGSLRTAAGMEPVKSP